MATLAIFDDVPTDRFDALDQTDPAVDAKACLLCGSTSALSWDTPDGVARLCHPCATLHDLGCP